MNTNQKRIDGKLDQAFWNHRRHIRPMNTHAVKRTVKRHRRMVKWKREYEHWKAKDIKLQARQHRTANSQ